MAMGPEDVTAMVEAARQRVAGNWRPRGTPLHPLTAGDVRPLTMRAAEMYLDYYAWLWHRDTPAEERRTVVSRLTSVAVDADWRLRDDVLVVCALWDRILELPEEDQIAARTLLGDGAEPGAYPELRPRLDRSPKTLAEASKQSAGQHDAVMSALQNRPKLPG